MIDQQLKDKWSTAFSWDKQRSKDINEALDGNYIHKVRYLMSDSEDELIEDILQPVICDEIEILNAKLETLKVMRDCYSELEEILRNEYYFDKRKKLEHDVHLNNYFE